MPPAFYPQQLALTNLEYYCVKDNELGKKEHHIENIWKLVLLPFVRHI
jgi:hypothetical protein